MRTQSCLDSSAPWLVPHTSLIVSPDRVALSRNPLTAGCLEVACRPKLLVVPFPSFWFKMQSVWAWRRALQEMLVSLP